ncbi:phosphotransferase [uncultured Vagococcus sp.]|uniref:phosphotransferase enzyme family protein n=1 Tax=uncultured Vagococcus sp. TaxID=189676 RepID=UPI0028D2FB98|nr:phosphotransferase [uncultured Vagococcus sp.]
MCHNDFAPYNVTFENNKAIGIIDFDTSCPGPRIWDVAYAVYRFVPLSHQVYEVSTSCYRTYTKLDGVVRKRLLGAFLRSYGELEEVDLFPIMIARLISLVTLFDSESQKGNQAFIKMKAEGHQSFYLKETEFIKKSCHDWH